MQPLKPKHCDSDNLRLCVSKTTSSILTEYEKYTGYNKNEIVEHLVEEIMRDDLEFMEWLKTKRFNKRAHKNILDISPESSTESA